MDDNQKQHIVDTLRGQFPWGHDDFIPLLVELMQLHSDKNHDYAGGGNPLGNFFREADIFALYPGLNLGDPRVVCAVNQMKQIDSTLWALCQGFDAVVEGIEPRQRDVAVYAVIMILLDRAVAASSQAQRDALVGLVAALQELVEKSKEGEGVDG